MIDHARAYLSWYDSTIVVFIYERLAPLSAPAMRPSALFILFSISIKLGRELFIYIQLSVLNTTSNPNCQPLLSICGTSKLLQVWLFVCPSTYPTPRGTSLHPRLVLVQPTGGLGRWIRQRTKSNSHLYMLILVQIYCGRHSTFTISNPRDLCTQSTTMNRVVVVGVLVLVVHMYMSEEVVES